MLVYYIGTSIPYLCLRKQGQNFKINTIMKNTDYSIDKLASMISSESSLSALLGMMGDMGLEMDSAVKD